MERATRRHVVHFDRIVAVFRQNVVFAFRKNRRRDVSPGSMSLPHGSPRLGLGLLYQMPRPDVRVPIAKSESYMLIPEFPRISIPHRRVGN